MQILGKKDNLEQFVNSKHAQLTHLFSIIVVLYSYKVIQYIVKLNLFHKKQQTLPFSILH